MQLHDYYYDQIKDQTIYVFQHNLIVDGPPREVEKDGLRWVSDPFIKEVEELVKSSLLEK